MNDRVTEGYTARGNVGNTARVTLGNSKNHQSRTPINNHQKPKGVDPSKSTMLSHAASASTRSHPTKVGRRVRTNLLHGNPPVGQGTAARAGARQRLAAAFQPPPRTWTPASPLEALYGDPTPHLTRTTIPC